MPKPDLNFAVRSIEVSSIALRGQMEKGTNAQTPASASATRIRARAKLQEALENHQRTMGRLMRVCPLQEIGLALSMSGEIGKLQQAGGRDEFAPDSKSWIEAARRWKELQKQALNELEKLVAQGITDAGAKKKAFGLALLASAMALFLDENAPKLSDLMQKDRYKTALSDLTMEQMMG